MRDPHIHVEKALIFNTGMVRDVVARVGLAVDAPRTVAVGCGRRRPYVSTSTVPAAVTCLACRDFAAAEHKLWATTGQTLIRAWASGDMAPPTATERAAVEENMRRHELLALEFGRN